jgi:hypothetical protein
VFSYLLQGSVVFTRLPFYTVPASTRLQGFNVEIRYDTPFLFRKRHGMSGRANQCRIDAKPLKTRQGTMVALGFGPGPVCSVNFVK